jgi:hypothetical protein
MGPLQLNVDEAQNAQPYSHRGQFFERRNFFVALLLIKIFGQNNKQANSFATIRLI